MPVSEHELFKRLLLAEAGFLTTKEKLLLQEAVPDAEALASCSVSDLSIAVARPLSRRISWDGKAAYEKARRAFYLLSKLSIRSVFFDDADFPPLLREISDAPYALFCRGDISCLHVPCVSVVGTRRATPSARKAAFSFAVEAAAAGCTVVSGLAYGIDVEAHKGALSAAPGVTAAVLASGIDTITPVSHTRVARSIIEKGGCIVSEYTPGTPAAAFRFVHRDRIIASLSEATVVIQAPAGSGALLTAEFALEYGRDVLFHSAAFSEESQILMRNNVDNLQIQLAQGRNVSYKIKNNPEKYVSDGAPVIQNYAEYCACRASAPGTAFCKTDAQMHLL